MKRIHIALICCCAALGAHAQQGFVKAEQMGQDQLRAHVVYLASDALQGRYTGSAGSQQAATYLVQQLQQLGLKPMPGQTGMLQGFKYTAEVRAGKVPARLSIERSGHTQTFDQATQVAPLSFTDNGSVQGQVVFAGYGLVLPSGYNSYAGLDVKDKIVVVLRYVPEGLGPAQRGELNRYSDLRFKAANAKRLGAKAMLVVTGPNSPNAGQLVPLRYDRSTAGAGLVAASVDLATAAALLPGTDLKKLQDQLDTARASVPGVASTVQATLQAEVVPVQGNDNNVLAYLPATTPSEEYVVIGAHYDHLGHGETSSLARKGEEGQVHNGADDNASGVATVLELARWLATEPVRKRNVVIAFWSGEELGLVGSQHYVNNPWAALAQTSCYFNFDMVGRLTNNKLSVQGVGSGADLKLYAQEFNRLFKFDLSLQDDPYLPTDVSAFYPKGVPVMAFFTNSHDDYHRPSDDAALLNYAGMAQIAAFAGNIIREVVNDDKRIAYQKVEQRSPSMGRSGGPMRVSVGTMPDYAYEKGDGMLLSGVRGGSPADKAGLLAGDLVVEMHGNPVKSVYDYMYVLGLLKGGEQVAVVVVRQGVRKTLTVVPEARN